MTGSRFSLSGVKVLGDAINAFLDGFPEEHKSLGIGILEKHGIASVQQDTFYQLQSFLDAMTEISENFSSQMLYRIGYKIATNARLPPEINAIEDCLPAINIAYNMNHRGGPIGSYAVVSQQGASLMNTTLVICDNPYPCSFDWGVIDGFAQRFRPPDCVDIIVRHDESKPCRKNGGESCTYIVSWV